MFCGAAPKKRQQFAIVERQEMVQRRYLGGESLLSIAKSLGLNYGTIWNDIEKTRQRWIDRACERRDVWVAQELAKIDKIEIEAWQGWTKSQQDATEHSQKRTKDGVEQTTKRKGQAGDSQFLQVALKCVERRCRLLGLDAPTRVDVTTQENDIADIVIGVVETREEAQRALTTHYVRLPPLNGDGKDGNGKHHGNGDGKDEDAGAETP